MGTPIWLEALGSDQGRIEPSGWTPPDGDWALCLGSDVPGVTGRLQMGDYVQATQAGQYPNTVMRMRARTRGPTTTPDGMYWEAILFVGDYPVITLPIEPGRTIDYADLGWEVVASAAGSLAFVLQLQGPSGAVAEAELPAFYVDAITFAPQPSADPRVYNRFPEPASIARAGDPISFTVIGDTAPDHYEVTVNGALAYSAGAFTPAFDGSESGVESVNGVLEFTVDPLAIWTNEEPVTVSIVYTQDAATISTWSFTGERTLGPQIVSVLALGYSQIRVTYDEAPMAVSAAGANDALNPALYAVTRTPGEIAVQPTILSVTQVSATVFDLAPDLGLSPSMTYSLTLQGVADALGNVTASWSPGATATFAGWVPPAPPGRNWDLYSKFITDEMRQEDPNGDLEGLIGCIQDCVDLLLYEVDSFIDILDPNKAPEQYVDAMLADLGNPFQIQLTLIQKRQLAQLLLPIYQTKGTGPGIEDAVRLFTGVEVEVEAVGWGSALDGVTDTLGDSSAPGWPIGPGESFFVLGSTVGIDPFSFVLETVAMTLPTAAQTATIAQIVQYMMRGECNYLGLVTPAMPAPDNIVLLGETPADPDWSDSTLGDGGATPGSFILH